MTSDDAFVDDGSYAFEQLAAGAELSVLRAGAERQAQRERSAHQNERNAV
jgi:hypothetical protein